MPVAVLACQIVYLRLPRLLRSAELVGLGAVLRGLLPGR
ncbi:hypothetical protein SAMN05428965_2099 [Geodermatophilus sp. DSM 45219]|nr:hypothetical protein SAMN05428965_2099 [Geodermatophilus sp. DSM 45219]